MLELWRRAGGSRSSTESAEDVLGLLGRDPEALLVAEVDRVLAGSVIVGWDGWRGTFWRIAVDPSHRRGGLGISLVRAGEERLRGLGTRRLQAIVETDHPDAMAFWSAAGYELQAERSRFVRNLE